MVNEPNGTSEILAWSSELIEAALGIDASPLFGNKLKSVHFAVVRRDRRRLFLAHFPLAQLIEAKVRHDPIKPSVKAAIEAKRMQVFINPKEGLLVDVTGDLPGI